MRSVIVPVDLDSIHGSGYLAEELEAHAIILAAVHGLSGEVAILRLNEEAAQALHHARGHKDVGAAVIELSLVLRCAQEG